MNSISIISSLLAQSLAWALLYSLLQGLLVYSAVYVILKALPDISARARYYISFGAFSLLLLWFVDSWVQEYQTTKGATVWVTSYTTANTMAASYTLPAVQNTHNPVIGHLMPNLERTFPFIIALYIAGLVVMLFRLVVNLLQVGRMRRNGIAEAGDSWNVFVAHWQEKLGIGNRVRLYLSEHISVPMVMGVIKPVILLPIATFNSLSTGQVEAILLHELAHIRRHDYLLNMFQALVETLLFFNPFVWLLSGIIRKEREHCCDDIVVATAADPLCYAKALTILEDHRSTGGSLALAATGNKNQLFNRIKRIMEMKKTTANYSQLAIVIAVVTAIVFSIAMFTFTPSFAQKKIKGENNDTAQKKNVYVYKTVTVNKDSKHGNNKKGKEGNEEEEKKNIDISISVNGDNTVTSVSGNDSDEVAEIMRAVAGASEDVAFAMANVDKIRHSDLDSLEVRVEEELENAGRKLHDADPDRKITVAIGKDLDKNKKEMRDEIHNAQHKRVQAIAVSSSSKMHAGSDYDAMLEKMEHDGLIDRSAKYSVRKENDELYINGEQQPAKVYDKYSRYLSDKSVTIKGYKGSLEIRVND